MLFRAPHSNIRLSLWKVARLVAAVVAIGCSESPSSDATGTGGTLSAGGSVTGGAANGSGGGTQATTGGEAGAAGAGPGTGGDAAGGSAGTENTGGNTATGGSSSENCPGVTSGFTASRIIYVQPNGQSTADGASFAAAVDLRTALNRVEPGEMVLLEPGTYSIPHTSGEKNTLQLSRQGTEDAPFHVVAAHCGRATLDFSFPEQEWVQDSFGLLVSGDYWYFWGIDITRAGYQGAYVTGAHNTFENCAFYDNRNSGLEINKGGSYTTIKNCDAYRNYDPKKNGSMADGFAPKQTQGPGNVLIGCRAWENSDDGFDAYDSPEQVLITDSWAFRNGVDVWEYGTFEGNGNGFKLGGNHVVARNRIVRSVAFGNVVKGFDQNNNAGGLTILHCTAYDNGQNFGLGNDLTEGSHTLRNNISLQSQSPDTIANADSAANSWDSGFSVSAADFVSLDLELATAPRSSRGELPPNALFRLRTTSSLIDSGVDVDLPFLGAAPDLGTFEAPVE